jgi:hypothetical protein
MYSVLASLCGKDKNIYCDAQEGSRLWRNPILRGIAQFRLGLYRQPTVQPCINYYREVPIEKTATIEYRWRFFLIHEVNPGCGNYFCAGAATAFATGVAGAGTLLFAIGFAEPKATS